MSSLSEPKAARESLIVDGRFMKCPRCRKTNDILNFVPMGTVQEFITETNSIYKCPECRWIFSPIDSITDGLTRIS